MIELLPKNDGNIYEMGDQFVKDHQYTNAIKSYVNNSSLVKNESDATLLNLRIIITQNFLRASELLTEDSDPWVGIKLMDLSFNHLGKDDPHKTCRIHHSRTVYFSKKFCYLLVRQQIKEKNYDQAFEVINGYMLNTATDNEKRLAELDELALETYKAKYDCLFEEANRISKESKQKEAFEIRKIIQIETTSLKNDFPKLFNPGVNIQLYYNTNTQKKAYKVLISIFSTGSFATAVEIG